VISQVPHISGPASAFAKPLWPLLHLAVTGLADVMNNALKHEAESQFQAG